MVGGISSGWQQAMGQEEVLGPHTGNHPGSLPIQFLPLLPGQLSQEATPGLSFQWSAVVSTLSLLHSGHLQPALVWSLGSWWAAGWLRGLP